MAAAGTQAGQPSQCRRVDLGGSLFLVLARGFVLPLLQEEESGFLQFLEVFGVPGFPSSPAGICPFCLSPRVCREFRNVSVSPQESRNALIGWRRGGDISLEIMFLFCLWGIISASSSMVMVPHTVHLATVGRQLLNPYISGSASLMGKCPCSTTTVGVWLSLG